MAAAVAVATTTAAVLLVAELRAPVECEAAAAAVAAVAAEWAIWSLVNTGDHTPRTTAKNKTSTMNSVPNWPEAFVLLVEKRLPMGLEVVVVKAELPAPFS